MMDIHSKKTYEIQRHCDNKTSGKDMLMALDLQSENMEREIALPPDTQSQQFFMMYATKNTDGTTTTVAFGGERNTNVEPQFRTKKPRNIVTNSTQSMFAGARR